MAHTNNDMMRYGLWVSWIMGNDESLSIISWNYGPSNVFYENRIGGEMSLRKRYN
jgi:hypothetical protein